MSGRTDFSGPSQARHRRRSSTLGAEGKSMRCSGCGVEDLAPLRFCRACGVRLAVACGACGTPCDVGSRFCGECGGSLEDSARPGTVATGADAAALSGAPVSGTGAGAAGLARGLEAEERRLVTILFADLVGFTALSERLDAE